MWESGWQPPARFVERCSPGVECCVDHKVEWKYAQDLVEARNKARTKAP
jgi:hypothetical protein